MMRMIHRAILLFHEAEKVFKLKNVDKEKSYDCQQSIPGTATNSAEHPGHDCYRYSERGRKQLTPWLYILRRV